MIRLLLAAVASLGFAASSANAAVRFSDNFDADPAALTVTSLPNWTVTGNVDVVNTGTYGITCSVRCVDLDGTTGPGALTSRSISFAAGKLITVSFDVSGNQRNAGPDDFVAKVFFTPSNGGSADFISGPASFNFPAYINMLNGAPYVESIAGDRSFLTYSYSFTPNVAGNFQLYFGTTSGDNVGPLLDNVLVTSVPEPGTWALMLAGLGMIGVMHRRARRRAAVA